MKRDRLLSDISEIIHLSELLFPLNPENEADVAAIQHELNNMETVQMGDNGALEWMNSVSPFVPAP